MIDTNKLELLIFEYLRNTKRPNKKGLARALGVSTTTVYNVINGFYNGVPYGMEPSCGRCIRNEDFEIVRNVFK